MTTTELIFVSLIALTAGTLMHFVYHWSGKNKFLGYFVPVDECVWEHMKMVFYPMLALAIYMAVKFNDIGRISSMILTGLISIPVMILLFFSYWPFTHHSVLTFDCVLYYGTLIVAIIVGNQLSDNAVLTSLWPAFSIIAVIVGVITARISYHKPGFWNFLFRMTDEENVGCHHHSRH